MKNYAVKLPGDQVPHAVPYHLGVLLQAMQGQRALLQRMIHGSAQILYGVDQCPVQVPEDQFQLFFLFHGPKIRFSRPLAKWRVFPFGRNALYL